MASPDHCPEEIWSIISECWNSDPNLRPSAVQILELLDELKVAVSSAPDGQYYGTGGGEYGTAGTVQGPSFDEILQQQHNMGFESEEDITAIVVDVHHTSSQDEMQEDGLSIIPYEHYREMEDKVRAIQRLVERSDVEKESLIDEIKFIVNDFPQNNNKLNSVTDEQSVADDLVDKPNVINGTKAIVETTGL